jgi:hypothetical protein
LRHREYAACGSSRWAAAYPGEKTFVQVGWRCGAVCGQVHECVVHLRRHVDRQHGREPPELRGQAGLGVGARPGMPARPAVPGGSAVKVFDLLHRRRQVFPYKPVGPGQVGALSRVRRGTAMAAGRACRAARSSPPGRRFASLLTRATRTRRTRKSGYLDMCRINASSSPVDESMNGRAKWAGRAGPAALTSGDRRPGRRSPAGVGQMAVSHAWAPAGHPVRGRRTHIAGIAVARPLWTVGRRDGAREQAAIDARRGQTATASPP